MSPSRIHALLWTIFARMPGLGGGGQPNFGNARILGAYGPPTPPLLRQVNLIPVREKNEMEERKEVKLPLVDYRGSLGMVERPGCSGDPQGGPREKDWILHPPNFYHRCNVLSAKNTIKMMFWCFPKNCKPGAYHRHGLNVHQGLSWIPALPAAANKSKNLFFTFSGFSVVRKSAT